MLYVTGKVLCRKNLYFRNCEIRFVMISKQDIERILDAVRIEEVIGEFVQLKKSGNSYKGLCPFHAEKTPSFFVTPSKNIYKCFGCGASGTAVNFLMQHEHFTYPEALRYLANKYGIDIVEQEPDEETKQSENERQLLFHLYQLAQQFYELCLWETNEGQHVALSYLRSRNIADHIIQKFSLGYVPLQSKGFAEFAIEKGYKFEDLQKAGLVIGQGDKFRGRIVFPVFSVAGRVLAFGGRLVTQKDDAPKYINSPETLIYQKGQVLYGLHLAKNHITRKDNCYIVEGYIDLLRMHQAGIQNVVATLGTSLTTDQIRLLRRYSNNVTVVFDGDAAGVKAALRGIDMLLEQGLNVKVILLPDNDDPDSFLLKNSTIDAEQFFEQHAEHFIYFKARLLRQEGSYDPVKQASMIKDIVQSISKVQDGILRTIYIRECSKITGIGEDILTSEVARQLRSSLLSGVSRKSEIVIPEKKETSEQYISESDHLKAVENRIIWLLLNSFHKNVQVQLLDNENHPIDINASVAEFIIDNIENDNLQFVHPYAQRVYEFFKEHYHQNTFPSIQRLLSENQNDPGFQSYVIQQVTFPYEISHNWEKELLISVMSTDNSFILLSKEVKDVMILYKLLHLRIQQDELIEQLKEITSEEQENEILEKLNILDKVKKFLAKNANYIRLE